MNKKTFAIVTAALAVVLAVSAVIVFTSRTPHGNNESFIDCESTVFTSDDIQPEFPGGRKAYQEYIRRNMNYPADALRNGVEGGVLIKFIVENDGSISNAEILRSMTESFDAEALRLICHMPNWTPGVWKGKTRRMQVIRLVDFRIEENVGLDIEADKADVQESPATTAFTQDKLKPGDIISGIVRDQEGPMMQVYVTERDSTGHVVTYCSTTMDGKFSFILVNPNDSLKASYVGYVPVIVPIDRTYIEIKMKEHPVLSPIDITGHGPNIRVVKPEELIDDGEGIFIEEIE